LEEENNQRTIWIAQQSDTLLIYNTAM